MRRLMVKKMTMALDALAAAERLIGEHKKILLVLPATREETLLARVRRLRFV
jgi:hypothetical protein